MFHTANAAIREGITSELLSQKTRCQHIQFFTPLRQFLLILFEIDLRQSSKAEKSGEIDVNCEEKRRH